MELLERLCKNCGGDLLPIDQDKYKCRYCGSVYEKETATNYANEMRGLFDEAKLEAISNARRNLYDAVNAEYISSEAVHECCVALKQLLPNDSQANFYEIAVGKNLRQLTKAIRKINVNEDGADIESVVNFLIRSLQTEYELELNNLIARAFENTDPVKFEKYCTMLSKEAEKVDNGVYETKLPREVFVAYSSKDMEKVSELVEVLEAQGLKCFVAARNLRHGKGAVESYNKALEEAMDHCRSLVFVSSTNSRSFNCDALTIELPYVQAKDTENAPAEYKNNYKAIPQQYKKPRVEYRIGESAGFNVADAVSNEIFDGYERAYTPEEVAERVVKQLIVAPKSNTENITVPAPAPMPKPEPKIEVAKETKKVKYCVECKSECPEDARFCMNCGGKSFAASVGEAELMLKIAALEKEKAELESRKAEAISVPAPAYVPATPIAKANPTPKQVVTPTPSQASKSNVRSITGLKFTSNGDKTCYVSGIGTCKDTDIVIPPTSPTGDKVTSIGDCAFKNCLSLESITIPKGVTSVGLLAFYGCTSLARLTIPNSVTSIGGYAFCDCSSLTSITIPDSVTSIGQLAFHGCTSLTSITISDSVAGIGNLVFKNCLSLKSITIPDSVTRIGFSAFEDCSSLTKIIFKNPVGWYNASGCIPRKIPENVFSDPRKAAESFKTKYKDVAIERK